MANAKNKTQQTDASVEDFLNALTDTQQRADSFKVLDLMKRISGDKPKMWGPSIIGFGLHHLKYASGRELDSPVIGFSPRKGNLTLYLLNGFAKYEEHLSKLGKYKTGKSCLYIKRLSDVDENVLENLVADSVDHVRHGALQPRHESV